MNTRLMGWVLVGYFTMFLVLGLLSIAATMGGVTPPPDVLQNSMEIMKGQDAKDIWVRGMLEASARFGKLGDIALSSFQIIIGTIIGFLSAIGSIALGGNSPRHELQK